MIPLLNIYVAKAASTKKVPDSKNFGIIKEFISDKLLTAKLGFLMSICLELEKFLIFYQSNKPLLPFLYSDLYALLKNLLTKIIKTEIIKNVKNGAKMSIDLENKYNFCDI